MTFEIYKLEWILSRHTFGNTTNFYCNLHDKNSKRLQNKNNQFSIKNYLPIK